MSLGFNALSYNINFQWHLPKNSRIEKKIRKIILEK
jgi:hypothetical protein